MKERNSKEEQEAIEAYLKEHKPKKLPKRSATAPSIKAIRKAIENGEGALFERGRSGRSIVFNPGAKKVVNVSAERRKARNKKVSKPHWMFKRAKRMKPDINVTVAAPSLRKKPV